MTTEANAQAAAEETPFEIAESWYAFAEIERAIKEQKLAPSLGPIPKDTSSPEFAKWMTIQYRLAMAKGIQLGRECPRFASQAVARGCQHYAAQAAEIERLERERDGWIEAARQYSHGREYYQSLLDQIATNFGEAAYISDDGSVQQDPLRAKMPELVAALQQRAKAAERERDSLKAELGNWKRIAHFGESP